MRRSLDKFLWRNFNSLTNISTWIRRRFTHIGKLVFTLMCVTAIVGIDTNNALSYQIFALSFVFLCAALFSSILFRAKFKIRRHLPQYCSVNQKFSYQLDITNLNKLNINRLSILDINHDPRPTFDEFHQFHEPKTATSNAFDRFFRYPRWLWMINQNTLSHTPITDVSDIDSGEILSVSISIMPLKRGILRFSHTEVFQHDQMGLYRAKQTISNKQTVLILPKRYQIPAIHLPGKRLHNPGGLANAGSVGDAEEFVSLREYRAGDSLRSIHWKSWAKMSRPIVKQYQEEYYSRYGLILDTFGSDALEPAFEEAVSLASSFIYSLHNDNTLMDLMFVANSAYTLSMGRGTNQTDRLLEVLASISLQKCSRFNQLYDSVERQIGVLSSVIIILLTSDPEREKLITLLQTHDIPYKIFLISTSNNETIDPPMMLGKVVKLEVGKIESGLGQ